MWSGPTIWEAWCSQSSAEPSLPTSAPLPCKVWARLAVPSQSSSVSRQLGEGQSASSVIYSSACFQALPQKSQGVLTGEDLKVEARRGWNLKMRDPSKTRESKTVLALDAVQPLLAGIHFSELLLFSNNKPSEWTLTRSWTSCSPSLWTPASQNPLISSLVLWVLDQLI